MAFKKQTSMHTVHAVFEVTYTQLWNIKSHSLTQKTHGACFTASVCSRIIVCQEEQEIALDSLQMFH